MPDVRTKATTNVSVWDEVNGSEKGVTTNPLFVAPPLIVVDSNNSTTATLGAGATYSGTAVDVSAYAQINVSLFARPSTIQGDGSNARASLFLEFSPDATNWDISIPILVRDPGLFIPYPLINVDRYFRVRYINDGGAAAIALLGSSAGTATTPVAQTAFRLNTHLLTVATKELARTIDQSVTGSDPVSLVRSVSMGQNPDGTYDNLPSPGIDATNSTTTLLGASTTIAAGSNGAALPQATINVASTTGYPSVGSILIAITSTNLQLVTYTGKTATSFTGCSGGTGTLATGMTVYSAFGGTYRDVTHWVGAAVLVKADQNGTIYFDISTTGSGDAENVKTYSYDATSGGQLFLIPLGGQFFRVRYANGVTTQTSFAIETKYVLSPVQALNVPLNVRVGRATTMGQITRADILPLTQFATSQQAVGTSSVLVARSLSQAKTISLKANPDNGNNVVIYIGTSASVSTSTGYPLSVGDSVEIELSDQNDSGATVDIYAISNSASNSRLSVLEVA